MPHFLHADHEAIIAIASRPHGHVEIHFRIDIIGLRLAQIPRNAAAPDHRARKAPAQRIVLADDANIDIALFENAIVCDQADRVFKQLRQPRVEPVGNVGEELQRHILMHPAGPEIGTVHPRARCAFKEVQAILADFEQPQVRRHRANIHHMTAQIQHVIGNARQFGEKDAQILRAQRHVEIEKLLDREHIAVLHAERRAIIEPVEIRERLKVSLVLDQLFGAAVEQAHMRVTSFDDLTVKLHDKAQNAVRRRMLRPEIDRVILNLDVARRWLFGVGFTCELFKGFHHASPFFLRTRFGFSAATGAGAGFAGGAGGAGATYFSSPGRI